MHVLDHFHLYICRTEEIILPSEHSGSVKEDYEWRVSVYSLVVGQVLLALITGNFNLQFT